MKIEAGAMVRFAAGPLGLVRSAKQRRFTDETVGKGDAGTYHGPVPGLRNWHLIKVGDGELFCPVHETMFEVVA